MRHDILGGVARENGARLSVGDSSVTSESSTGQLVPLTPLVAGQGERMIVSRGSERTWQARQVTDGARHVVAALEVVHRSQLLFFSRTLVQAEGSAAGLVLTRLPPLP